MVSHADTPGNGLPVKSGSPAYKGGRLPCITEKVLPSFVSFRRPSPYAPE